MNYHTKVSYVKSALRMVGYLMLGVSLLWGIGVLILAELLGIAEEF